MLKPGGKQEVKVNFSPVEAKVVISTVVVNLGEGDFSAQKVLKMSGIGKFPFVSINHEKLDFESLTVGQEAFKTVELERAGGALRGSSRVYGSQANVIALVDVNNDFKQASDSSTHRTRPLD